MFLYQLDDQNHHGPRQVQSGEMLRPLNLDQLSIALKDSDRIMMS